LFQFSSIADFHAALNNGSITCVQAVQHYLSRIASESSLNAFVEVYAGEALDRAAWLDEQPQKGRLHGVVIGLKDNICYKDHPVTAGSNILSGFISLYSATAVERLLDEGAIIIGRQNCDEFGMGSTNENSAYGPVLNPDNPAHVAGGSSGGSAAAVKAGMCMAALGSDTGGSVRLPADFCGVVGFKPAYGTVSRYGLISYASSFDQIGILANSVEDVALVFDVISGPDAYDSTARTEQLQPPAITTEEKKYRIAYFPEWIGHPSIDPEISAALMQLLNKLKESGHTVEPVHFELTDYIVPAYYILTTAEASSNLARYDGVRFGQQNPGHAKDLTSFYKSNRSHGFGSEVSKRIMLGSFVLSSGYYDAYYTKAQQVRQLLKQQTDLIFSKYDFIIAPTAPTTAYKLADKSLDAIALYMGDIFTVFANLTGVPAISLPVFKHSSNLSYSFQCLSTAQNVVFLLRFTHQMMQQ
jgi:aspartyl-tRNA(Asn)/glutamyl-tRNA(Gln) amidotransferase subunit A